MIERLRSLAARARGEPAVLFALASRIAQLVAAPITLLVIAQSFSPETQGYYYTFASLIALQSFAELGFAVVIVNMASHEWSKLSLDAEGRPHGDPIALARLVSLGRLTVKWYAAASTLFVVGVTMVGYVFFSTGPDEGVSWQAPWTALVVVAGLQLWMLSFTSILEGCNQVSTVYRFRLLQVIATNTALWVTALAGGGLWAGVAAAAARLFTDYALVMVKYRRFFEVFRRPHAGAQMHWQTEIWPMQWRLALSGIVNYFAFSLFNPVMFRYHGAVAAGQMGMTLQAVGGLTSVAQVMISTRVPRFGMLIAQRDYPSLDRLWWRVGKTSFALLALMAAVLLVAIATVGHALPAIAARLLDVTPTAMLLGAALLMHVSQCETAYMRAHRAEPIVVLSVTTSVLSGIGVWTMGKEFGSFGATGSYLAVMIVLVVWETIVWWQFRSRAILAASRR